MTESTTSFELQAVLDNVVESAARLFRVRYAALYLLDGDELLRVATYGERDDAERGLGRLRATAWAATAPAS